MKIIAISDTHEKHKEITIPEGDMLIHAGDFTFTGKFQAVADFAQWMKSQPHKYKICIAGNHELTLDPRAPNRNIIINLLKEAGIIYLEDSSIELEDVKFYGSPHTPFFYDWAFNLPRGGIISKKWEKIPEDVNVLITHGPPYGILDDTSDAGSQGCEELAKRVKKLTNLKVHVFGHLHRDGGKIQEHNGVKFINAAICTDNYKPINHPIIIEI